MPRWSSRQLLLCAMITSALVVAGGQIVVWSLYEATLARSQERPTGVSASTGAPLVVGVGRIHGGPSEWMTFAKVFAQLQRDLERPIVLRYALDSSESVEVLNRGEVDIALISANAYLKAQRDRPHTLVAAPRIAGSPMDSLVLVADGKSDVQDLEDLRGHRLLLPPDSLAGRPFVRWVLRGRDEQLGDFFSAVEESGAQDANLAAVANGAYDATAVRRSALLDWPQDAFRIVAESPGFGTSPVVARAGLATETVTRVRNSLLDVADRALIPSDSAIDGFAVVADADYEFARVLGTAASKAPTGPE